MNPFPSTRPSPIAGAWYPSNPKDLREQINGYLEQAPEQSLPGEVVGVIAPHAGYFYSGATAGYAYRCVRGNAYDTCVIFSPLHDYQPYDLLTSAHSAYATPLGEAPIDRDLVEACAAAIQDSTGVTLQPIANDREHSLEIQLPFLQTALGKPFRLLPLMVRSHDAVVLEVIANAISKVIANSNALLVASTDLSHFYTENEADLLDSNMLRQMSDFSPQGVLNAERTGEGFACGAGAVALMMWTCRFLGAKQVTLLHHSTSADASGDSSRVVGYGALAVTR